MQILWYRRPAHSPVPQKQVSQEVLSIISSVRDDFWPSDCFVIWGYVSTWTGSDTIPPIWSLQLEGWKQGLFFIISFAAFGCVVSQNRWSRPYASQLCLVNLEKGNRLIIAKCLRELMDLANVLCNIYSFQRLTKQTELSWPFCPCVIFLMTLLYFFSVIFSPPFKFSNYIYKN